MRNLIIVGCMAVATTSAGAEERRQLGAHEHGVGHLDIAVEGNSLVMSLRVPGSVASRCSTCPGLAATCWVGTKATAGA